VNLNIGCPSGTVTAKGKGAGMLADPDNLDRFLDAIYEKAPLPISVKTRLGINDPEEFPRLVEIFNRYPIRELTLHPRVRKAFYTGPVHMDSFRYLLENSKNPICYNGNLCSMSQIKAFSEEFPQVESLMIGRALIGNPGMLTPHWTMEQLESFCQELLLTYKTLFGSARNAMFRMKENWGFLLPHFIGSEKLGKQLRKCTDFDTYQAITREIFATLPWQDTP
jgi:tRNA-dihydrouridine synthase